MGGILIQHHQISPNPLRKAGFPGSFASQRDIVLLCAPLQGFVRCSSSMIVRSEANGSLPPGTVVKKHSKEELIEFFRGIQAAIARDSPKASRRTRKPAPADLFEDAGKQSYEEVYQDGQPNLEDMKVAELREMAKARQMRGYSKLKKGELIDRLKRGLVS
ncbi:uncharacterized protein LOC124667350 [Lolium rigidum]|uniref:uncharacterized protein LOC124667350 n=1 Tax=Lolium rigidum TaxID=89674 RepID=UPI001F5DD80E|nr:uncharacterized protein LOC124667350 [Lolium rigidum]